MEHPSRELVQQLASLGLASASDLRRCAGRVRRLARGLPVTDGVWMDALVLSGRLSPYQVRLLEADQSHELVVGRRFVLRDPLHRDPLLSVSTGQIPGRRDRVHLSRMPVSPGEGEAAALRLLKTVKNLSLLKGQLSFLPFDAVLERDQVYLIAPFQEGESLARLLVRRGRFPEAVVRVLAQEILRSLQAAESISAHGDLRPANLWLTHRGELHLLNWGLLDAVHPEITIHSRLPLDACDGLAPERIDSSQRAVPVSDIYAFGCLLWQLLTGRPPFAVADPLAKMTAHRQKQIPDVRTLAPDVSESFALLVRNMTSREAHRRPQRYSEIAETIGTSSAWNRRRLQGVFQQFETVAPGHPNRRKVTSRLPAMAGTVLLTAGLCLAAWNRDLLGWPRLSRVSAAIATVSSSPQHQETAAPPQRSSSPSAPVEARTSALTVGVAGFTRERPTDQAHEGTGPEGTAPLLGQQLLPLPSPTLEGVLLLEESGPYTAGNVITGETLVLKGNPAAPAIIRIQDLPLVLEADHIRLEHVQIEVDAAALGKGISPVQLRGETLSVYQSVFRDHRPGLTTPLVQWISSGSDATAPVRLLLHETRVETAAAVLSLDVPLGGARFDQVLVCGATCLLDARRGAASGVLAPAILDSCTIRDCRAVVSLPGREVLQQTGRVSLQGEETVIALSRGGPLVLLPEEVSGEEVSQHLEVNAQGLIVEMGTMLIGRPGTHAGNPFQVVPDTAVRVDGLLSGDFHFEPPAADGTDRHQVVIDALPVRVSSQLPGVQVDRLPD